MENHILLLGAVMLNPYHTLESLGAFRNSNGQDLDSTN